MKVAFKNRYHHTVLESQIPETHFAMPLSILDKYDIQRSFEVMDEEKTNRINMNNFHTLFLGLGFQPKEMTLTGLRTKVVAAINQRKHKVHLSPSPEDTELFEADVDETESFLPLSVVFEILSEHSRDRSTELDTCFELLDHSNKGYVDEDDLQKLAHEIGEPMTLEEGKALLASVGSNRVGPSEFKKLFTPPSP